MNTVYVKVIAWCDIIKSGCDVVCIHMMSCILCLCYHTHNGGYMIDNLGVNTEIQWVLFHTYIGCDVISQVGLITQIHWVSCQIQ